MSNLSPESLYSAAVTAYRDGRNAEAIGLFRRLIELSPRTAEYHNALGTVLARGGMLDEARESFDTAIALSPGFVAAHYNLGNVLSAGKLYERAITAYRRAVELDPRSAEAYNNLGTALIATNKFDDAIEAYQWALAIQPDLLPATLSIGTLLRDTGQLERAIECYQRFLARRSDPRVASGLLYSMLFHSGDAKLLYEEHAHWNDVYAAPVHIHSPKHIDRSPNRRLRIGYVSPDFRHHVVGYNLLPLLREHDRNSFEVVCYSNVAEPDSMTDQFRELAGLWREIRAIDDRQAADLIREDGIDILVDTSLHMADNRLLVFAQKPAPIQVTFAGYPGTTGLTAMDFRLTDRFLDPPAQSDEHRYSERSIRLEHSFWCFDALADSEIAVAPPPSVKRGFVTFGYLGAFAKITSQAIATWAKVLRSVGDSHMLVLAPAGSARERLVEHFNVHGIAARRVEFADRWPRRKYLETYDQVDVFLDSFPYNGHSTSLDALWMGVPVVSMTGDTVVSRAGLSILSNVGLEEFVGANTEDFVRIASTLANDLPRREMLRATMRQRMRRSPLMNGWGFARDVETAYRQMRDEWLANPTGS